MNNEPENIIRLATEFTEDTENFFCLKSLRSVISVFSAANCFLLLFGLIGTSEALAHE